MYSGILIGDLPRKIPSDYPVTCKAKNIDKWSQTFINKLALHILILDGLYGAHLNSIYHYYM